MAEDADILILSGSDSSGVEFVVVSSDEDVIGIAAKTIRAGNPHRSSTSWHDKSNKINKHSFAGHRSDQLAKYSLNNIFDTGEISKKMTCESSHSTRHEKKSHKSWSQIKKEREKQRQLPPACKRAKMTLPEPTCSHKLGHDFRDELSDDLPDLDRRQSAPGRRPVALASPITLSSDDEASGGRPGIFASLVSVRSESVGAGTQRGSAHDKNEGASNDGNKLLLTESAKERMASIFNNVIRQKSALASRPQSPSGFSDMSSSTSSSSRHSNTSSRHFLDAIESRVDDDVCSSPLPRLIDDPVSRCLADDEVHVAQSDLDSVEPGSDSSSSCSVKIAQTSASSSFMNAFDRSPTGPSPKKARLDNVKEGCLNLPKLDIRKHFPVKPGRPCERLGQQGRSSRHVSYDSKFVCERDLAAVTADLTHLHVNTVDAVFEEGEAFLAFGLSLVSDFSSNLKPTEHVVKEIVNKCLLGNSSMYVSYKAFKLLSYLWQKYPSCVHIDWEVFSRVLGDLAIEKGLQVVPSPSVVKGSLFLQVVVQALQADLHKRSLQSLVDARRSPAYKLLSVDCAYANLKQIVYWLGSVVTSEYTELGNHGNARLGNHVRMRGPGDNSVWCEFASGCVPKVLPNLQKLLDLGIHVSRSCVDAAKRIAAELVQTYVYLPDIRRKKLLLQSMASDLLRFKVTQKILEDHCDGTSMCCEDFPGSLRQVVDAYYLACPPRSLVTPPQSPSDDEGADPATRAQQYSAASCEELAFLVYTNTQSYIRCAHDSEHRPVCQREPQSHDYSFLSSKDQQRLRNSVDEFHDHLSRLTAEVNGATHAYLLMMRCLGNLH